MKKEWHLYHLKTGHFGRGLFGAEGNSEEAQAPRPLPIYPKAGRQFTEVSPPLCSTRTSITGDGCRPCQPGVGTRLSCVTHCTNQPSPYPAKPETLLCYCFSIKSLSLSTMLCKPELEAAIPCYSLSPGCLSCTYEVCRLINNCLCFSC